MRMRLIKNKKGISPVFVSIYMAILTIILLSTLFVALYTYGSSVSDMMKLEEERQLESVGLAGPQALKLNRDNTIITELRVNNTGSITIRIRALFINHKFILDPSKNTNDSYVNPNGYIWIQLSPLPNGQLLYWNDTTLNSEWTVTTQRGTTAHEIGAYLYYPKTEPGTNPMRFYIGPLMIMFDMFHWRSGTGPWISGWSIPKSTSNVTWRILISNVDNRDIQVTSQSSLTLICNDNAPKDPIPWYINTALSSMYYKPGSFYFVYFSWSTPANKTGNPKPQSMGGGSPPLTYITFLQFLGSFIEPNGTSTSYGQTIPFEAVLETGGNMPTSLQLTANPQSIRNDGISTSKITATVLSGTTPVPNSWVDFYTTAGGLSAAYGLTDTNGIATVTLTSTTAQTTANLVAISQGVAGTAKVSFTPARYVRITANPTQIAKGGTSSITIQLRDATNSNNISQAGIVITITSSNTNAGQLQYGAQPPGSTQTVTTDTNGRAILTFIATAKNKQTNISVDPKTLPTLGLIMDPPSPGVTITIK